RADLQGACGVVSLGASRRAPRRDRQGAGGGVGHRLRPSLTREAHPLRQPGRGVVPPRGVEARAAMSGGDLELQPLPGFNERDGRTNVRADRTIAPLISSHAGLASWHVDARPRAEPEPGGIAYAVAFRGTRRVEASPSPIART